jgi:very-short-patch-repair endonuclease
MVCENCKNEYEKDYRLSRKSRKKSSRFCSRKCASNFNLIKAKLGKRADDKICDKCLEYFRPNNLEKHKKSCGGDGRKKKNKGLGWGWTKNKTYEEIYGKEKAIEIKNKLSLKLKIFNEKNPDIQKDRWTNEKRENRSKEKIEFYREHPEKHPNRILSGNKYVLTFPEKLCMEFLEKRNISFKDHIQIDKFFPDFIILGKFVIEVDGEQWHKNDTIEKTKKRDLIISKITNLPVIHLKAKGIIKQLEILFNEQ